MGASMRARLRGARGLLSGAGLALTVACGRGGDRARPRDAEIAAARVSDSVTAAATPGAAPDSIEPMSSRSSLDSLGTTAAKVLAIEAPDRRVPPARDAEQLFLRRMLDHHEGVVRLVHDRMMDARGHATHSGKTDPSAFDSFLDSEKREMLSMLATLYQEDYSPVPAALVSPRPATSAAPDSSHGRATPVDALAVGFRAGVELIDRFHHHLRRPQVRALAERLRRTELAWLRELTSSSAH